MSRKQTTTATQTQEFIMENTRSPYRPNVRRLTSSRALVITHLVTMALAIGIAGMLWTLLFMWIAR